MPITPVVRAVLAGMLLGAPAAGQSAQLYQERYRPQFHFSPRVNWTNDPNGLVYFNGTYNLFFQFNPLGDVWGHMSWGHAVSPDLLHWREQPVALREENGIMVFTGSTVVDSRNTSGFCKAAGGCLVAIYTGHTMKSDKAPALQTQNLAFSNDGGVTWTKYSGNPVLDLHMTDFRDPKVLWSQASKQWIMVVALPDDHKARFYGSPDLKKWTQLSEFGPAGTTSGQWECPELFELPVDAPGSGKSRWIFKVGLNPGALQGGSGEQYFVGRFDGRRFVNDNPPSKTLWTDYGKDCYCALTFNNLPATEQPVMIGWMNNWQYANQVPTKPWRGQMTFPRELRLKSYPDGIRLMQQPVAAIEKLREKQAVYRGNSPSELNGKLANETGQALELIATSTVGSASETGWRVLAGKGAYTVIGYDARAGQLFVDRTHSGEARFSAQFPGRFSAPYRAGAQLKLRILIDRSSIEVFAGEGEIAMTNLAFPPEGANKIEQYAVGGAPGPASVEVWHLRSIW